MPVNALKPQTEELEELFVVPDHVNDPAPLLVIVSTWEAGAAAPTLAETLFKDESDMAAPGTVTLPISAALSVQLFVPSEGLLLMIQPKV